MNSMVIGGAIGAAVGLMFGLLCNGALSATFGYVNLSDPDYPTTYMGWLKRHGVRILGSFILLGIAAGILIGWATIAEGI